MSKSGSAIPTGSVSAITRWTEPANTIRTRPGSWRRPSPGRVASKGWWRMAATRSSVTARKRSYEACALILHKKRLEGFTVTTGGSLRKKLHYFPADESEQYDFFVSGRYGNDNARKIGKCKVVDEETGEIKRFDLHEALILKLWMNFGGSAKESKIALWNQYERDINYLGEKPLSYSTFCHYTNMYNTRRMTYRERHGWKAFSSTFLSYIPSEKLRYGNSLWCADGSGTRLFLPGQRGQARSMRLYVMMVSDVATGKIVGWAPAPVGQHSESPEMMREAVLMGLRNCGKREIMEFISDNHGAFTSDDTKSFCTGLPEQQALDPIWQLTGQLCRDTVPPVQEDDPQRVQLAWLQLEQ